MPIKNISRMIFWNLKILKSREFVSYSTAELNMLTQQDKCHIPYVSENADTSPFLKGILLHSRNGVPYKPFFEGKTYGGTFPKEI